MKTFKIEATEANTTWVNENLDARDFTIKSNEIVITYFNEMQKTDILNAIEVMNTAITSEALTYNIFFNDDTNSNDLGLKSDLEYCENYIEMHNGSNHSYFEDYKGGTVSIVCNETEETVFETEVK